MYSIEFQKRGLPHAHLLLFLHPSSKYPIAMDIDKVISAEIPCAKEDAELYNCVKEHMIHGPCGISKTSSPCMKNGSCSRFYPKKFEDITTILEDGFPHYRRRNNGLSILKNGSCSLKHMIHGPCGISKTSSPCMKNGSCSRFYPKKFEDTTTISEDGFPHYRRRNNGLSILKNDIALDNRFVVPYNPTILVKYQTHVNVEWYNRSNSIKYLFKYINKGYDRIIAAIVSNEKQGFLTDIPRDEIKQYIDCRYISPCEACWRIFSFPIHGRNPTVERLFFHLPGDQSVYFKDDDDIDEIMAKPIVRESMFTSWMECNKKYSDARELTYPQFVTKYVYNKNQRCWKPRKKGNTIGRLI